MHEALVGNEYANNLAEIGMEIEKGKKELDTVFAGIIKRNKMEKLKINKIKLQVELKECNEEMGSRLMKEIALITAEEEKLAKIKPKEGG
jgi:hypothetical protein